MQIASELRLLSRDLFNVAAGSIILSGIATILYASNGYVTSYASAEIILRNLFGSVSNEYINWIYWIIMCIGYIVLLQLVWKRQVHTFELYQLIRFGSARWYWILKMMIGFIFTLYYIFCYLCSILIMSSYSGAPFHADIYWIKIFISLTLNLYVHACIWLLIKELYYVEIANITIVSLFYMGVRLDHPYLPLYYSMIDHVSSMHPQILMAEFIVIAFIGFWIVYRANRVDY